MENKVKEQYTQFTYPKYNASMDVTMPIPSQYSNNLFLEQINHYIYAGGKSDWNNYKVLVAGVGLGNDIISMGYLLKKYTNVKLVGIDVSPTAINICKERVAKYDLDNIELIEISLLDLKPEIHGKFDLIICIGVLHHLRDPEYGLNCLTNVLEDNGAISIMVYGKYGRTGIYQMQDLLRKINNNIDDYSIKINNYKNIYKQLPHSNWFKLNEYLINDHRVSDEGIVDLLLHCQDRAYTVNELYEWIDNCKLNIVEFSPDTRYKYKYNIQDVRYPDILIERYAINELFFGDINKHIFYVSKNTNTKANIDDLDNILILGLIKKEHINNILKQYDTHEKNIVNINVTLTYKLNDKFTWYYSNNEFIQLQIEMNDIIYTILKNIDNTKTIKEIFNIVRTELNIGIDDSEILHIFKPVYDQFELYDFILLKK